jgi:aminoglycoside 6'-N-acetyltransferase
VAVEVAAGDRALLVAEDDAGIVGTVQLVLDQPENQPHRADLVKMLVDRRARRKGLGAELLHAAEDTARWTESRDSLYKTLSNDVAGERGAGSTERAGDATILTGSVVRLRPASRSDVPALAAIRRTPEVHKRWRGGADMVAAVKQDFSDSDSTPYVIEHDRHVAGWIQWQAEDEPDYRHASIDIYVDPALHGRGIGSDAVRTLASHLIVDHGHHRLEIDPTADNEAAIRCYTKVRFRPVRTRRRSERGYDGTWHDALLRIYSPRTSCLPTNSREAARRIGWPAGPLNASSPSRVAARPDRAGPRSWGCRRRRMTASNALPNSTPPQSPRSPSL